MGILCPATNGGTSPHTPPLRIRKSDEIEDKKPGQGQPLWTRRSHPPSGDIKAIQYPIDATATRLTTAMPTVTRTRPTATRRRPIVKGTPAPMATTTTPISATSKPLDSAAFQDTGQRPRPKLQDRRKPTAEPAHEMSEGIPHRLPPD